MQLHHSGRRSPYELIWQTPVAPSADDETGARALDEHEVRQLVDDFVSAAVRAQWAGFDGVRTRCGSDFSLGIRLSPERYGQRLPEIRELCRRLLQSEKLDYIDLSLWDAFKYPEEEQYRERRLMEWFTDLERGHTRLGVAGKIYSAQAAQECLRMGADFVLIGRAAILHHDFPARVMADAAFESQPLPVSRDYLREEGLSPIFIDYIKQNWPHFIAP